MKKIAYSLVLLSIVAFADLSVQQIESMIGKIHEQREGVKLETLQTTKEPFVRMQEENNITVVVIPVKMEEAKLTLHAIMNGKAYINDQWYIPEDKIMGYTLKQVGDKGVELKNDENVKKLFLSEEKESVIHIEERR